MGEINMDEVKKLREESGNIGYTDPLVSFLYLLMRDELVPGKVEKIVQDICKEPGETIYTNGWLAKYADNLARRIKNDGIQKLTKSLECVIDTECPCCVEEKEENHTPKSVRPYFKCGKPNECECLQSSQSNESCECKQPLSEQIDDYIDEKLEECEKVIGNASDEKLVEDAEITIDELLSDGSIKEDEAQFLKDEINNLKKENASNEDFSKTLECVMENSTHGSLFGNIKEENHTPKSVRPYFKCGKPNRLATKILRYKFRHVR